MTAPEPVPDRSPLPTKESTNSFWHKEPSEILLGHKTTPELPQEVDVVVIGSGIAGSFAAWELLEGGHGDVGSVLMVEAREACWGATGRNGGHCAPNLWAGPTHISRWELANFEFLREFVKTHEVPCHWQNVDGVRGFYSQSIFDMAVIDATASASLDPELAENVSIIYPGDNTPGLNFKDLRLNPDNTKGAIRQKHCASVWPYKLVSWVLENLLAEFSASTSSQHNSFNLQTNTPATTLSQGRDGKWIIKTERGEVTAKKVLLCTNAYTSHLLPEFADLIVPVRGQMSALLPPPSMTPETSTPLAGNFSYGLIGNAGHTSKQDDYLVQQPFTTSPSGTLEGGELMFGGGRGVASLFGLAKTRRGEGVADDSFIDETVACYLRAQLNNELDLQNSGEELEASHEWTGIMGYSRDGYPWVGEVPDAMTEGGSGNGMFIAAGYTGHGMANATLAARKAAQIMMGKKEGEGQGMISIPDEMFVTEERVNMCRGLVQTRMVDYLEDDLHC